MQECLLCKRDMKKTNNQFGNGCLNNIYKFLEIEKPKHLKDREKCLYKNVVKKTCAVNLNKEQEIWLTDRYLARQYLDGLHNEEFEKLKAQLDNDIETIKRGGGLKELITYIPLPLKVAYNIYKAEIKFVKLLNQFQRELKTDPGKIKLTLSSLSFIFNFANNKNKYEKNAFKAFQYAFWQAVIDVGRTYAGYDFSAYLLQHSLAKNPKNISITEGRYLDLVKNDENFKNVINKIVKDYGKNKSKFKFDSKKDGNYPLTFSQGDLYFSINKATLKIDGVKKDNKWHLKIHIKDKYDYTKFKNIDDYINDTNSISKSIFSSTLYNLAYLSSRKPIKVINTYDVKFIFEVVV